MSSLQLDNSIEGYKEREDWVNKEMDRIGRDKLTSYQLDRISTYLIDGTSPEPRGEIITQNRLVTVNKREVSREGLVEKLEGGENAFHQLIKQDRNTILTPRVEITEKDIEEVPGLAQLREGIASLEKELEENENLDKKTRGKIKQIIIEMRRDQYVMKNSFRQPIFGKGSPSEMGLSGDLTISLQDPEQVLSLIMQYSSLKVEFKEDNNSDIKWILEDLDELIEESFKDKPTLMYILMQKIIGSSNMEIKEGLLTLFGKDHTQEYISSLYRNKIPKTIAETARKKWMNHMYMNKIKGVYKECSRCKEIKLANNTNFSINRTSSSKFYSICKACRNSK